MVVEDFEKGILALLCWREARGEGIDGMLAVACVVANRVRAWKKSWCEVIDAHDQFSSMTVKGDSQTIVYPDVRDPLFLRLIQALDAIYEGRSKDVTNGALYYGDLQDVTSDWFKVHILGDPSAHPLCARIGRHSFFR